jgi:hypothetical protein
MGTVARINLYLVGRRAAILDVDSLSTLVLQALLVTSTLRVENASFRLNREGRGTVSGKAPSAFGSNVSQSGVHALASSSSQPRLN